MYHSEKSRTRLQKSLKIPVNPKNPYKSRCGNLCFFWRVDCEKCLVDRVVLFSYLTGSKKQRQYSSDYVDLTKDSCKNIGVLASWFQGIRVVSGSNASWGLVTFKPIENIFTPGYLPIKHYVGSIDESSLPENLEFSLSIPVQVIQKVLPNWHSKLTFEFNWNKSSPTSSPSPHATTYILYIQACIAYRKEVIFNRLVRVFDIVTFQKRNTE